MSRRLMTPTHLPVSGLTTSKGLTFNSCNAQLQHPALKDTDIRYFMWGEGLQTRLKGQLRTGSSSACKACHGPAVVAPQKGAHHGVVQHEVGGQGRRHSFPWLSNREVSSWDNSRVLISG
jgi:hypothetical protein